MEDAQWDSLDACQAEVGRGPLNPGLIVEFLDVSPFNNPPDLAFVLVINCLPLIVAHSMLQYILFIVLVCSSIVLSYS